MRTIPEGQIVTLLDAQKRHFPNGAGEAVDHWVIEQGPDSMEKPAIRVWLIFKDELAGRLDDVQTSIQISDQIQGLLYAAFDVHFDFDLSVYVLFRSASEQAELLAPPQRRQRRAVGGR